ncbi:G2/mitotic-specific cyclin-B3 [Frankliniella fusca]|uniref:G2/mitotic-specific cyclin-B3 n=1 Tax=Frankliniella fusca TaxID=407009 RepID=A0AAE1HJE6_9NEOP|nr:G2/mitotic-specific cyclin-B3 [Frankliniella fusca]
MSSKFRCLTCGSLSAAIVTAKLCYDSFKPVLQGHSTMPPPTRSSSLQWKNANASSVLGNGVATRAKRATSTISLSENQPAGKRKAESPLKKPTKRSALGEITNAIGKSANDTKNVLKNVANGHSKAFSKFKDKKVVEKEVPVKEEKKVPVKEEKKNLPTRVPNKKAPAQKPSKSALPTRQTQAKVSSISLTQHVTRKAAAAATTATEEPSVSTLKQKAAVKEPVRASARLSARLSLTNDTGETSLYVSALDINPDQDEVAVAKPEKSVSPQRKLPAGVVDFDAESATDPFAVSEYAYDIFEYLKGRESKFKVADYMDKQIDLTRFMRSLLVDWMVEVQENFELNHETLYLGVKIVDTYLSKVPVGKQTLQLVGAAAMFIASKYDERVPPLVDDLTYICDGAYNHDELIAMEVSVLRVLGFDLSMPISYRFLRRYARCAKIAMPQLTLARYILELTLLEYSMVTVSDSKIAAAALLLALKMQNLGGWTPTLEYYSGYKLEDIHDLCHQLNDMLHKKPKTALQTVRNKYSHKVFFEVANIPLVDDLKL